MLRPVGSESCGTLPAVTEGGSAGLRAAPGDRALLPLAQSRCFSTGCLVGCLGGKAGAGQSRDTRAQFDQQPRRWAPWLCPVSRSVRVSLPGTRAGGW